MASPVISLEHLSKYYNLGVINNGSLYRDIQSYIALKRGKNDPHSSLTAEQYATTADGFWALKDLNFQINQGDRVGIVGKNGAGKSTLLKILSRITAPTKGRVRIKGRVASLLEVGTGFHGELTGRENIYLNGSILGMKKHEIDKKIDEIIAFSEIENHIDTPVKRYSSGMYVRLAFAVAAHLDSDILIADEVLAVGDAAFQKKAIGKMNSLSTSEGRTILFVSHQMEAVSRLCTSGIILNKGRLDYQSNSISELVSRYLRPENIATTKGWQNNGDVKKDVNFTPQKAYLVRGNDVCTEFLHGDSNTFCVVEADIEDVHNSLNLVMKMYRESDNTLLYETSLKDPTNEVNLKKGRNTIFIELPIAFLPAGRYYIDFSAGVHNVKEIFPSQTIMLSFAIISENMRGGAVLYPAKWTTR